MSVGKRIKDRRKEMGLTQIELAEKLGYKSKAAISTVENDKEDLTTTRLMKYAEALSTSPAYLMGWTDDVTGYKSKVEKNHPDKVTFDCLITENDIGELLIEYERTDAANTRMNQRLVQYATMLSKICNSLNEEGINKLMDYADDLVSSNKYKKGE